MGKHHDKGQSDASEGKYDPPHGIIKDVTTWTPGETRRITEENRDYNKGHEHGKKQM